MEEIWINVGDKDILLEELEKQIKESADKQKKEIKELKKKDGKRKTRIIDEDSDQVG
jgi:hypothetical protein